MESTVNKVGKMEYILESQNVIVNDLFTKVTNNGKRLSEFENIDLDDRLNALSRKMIAEVCRELLTPV